MARLPGSPSRPARSSSAKPTMSAAQASQMKA
jgi:hypothetical protein